MDHPSQAAEFGQIRAVADAICYEGYLLYPYRRSSPKNRVRWQFGVLAPRGWVEADGPVPASVAGSAESWQQQTACLFEAAPGAVLRVLVRFLQLQSKHIERRTHRDGPWEFVESLETDGELQLSFDEAVPHETLIELPLAELLEGERTYPVGAPGGEETTVLADGGEQGTSVRVVRRRRPVQARTSLRVDPLEGPGGVDRLIVRTENTDATLPPGTPREEALGHALLATHTLLGGAGLEFVSLIDPPPRVRTYARACRNLHTFPVLAGEEGTRRMMFSSPILLDDHPRVAPESPGDLHDAAEIDELLSLRTLLLTDEEKREARATDPRAAAILDRVENMPQEVFARLHGAIRSLEPARHELSDTEDGSDPSDRAEDLPWWREGGDAGLSPATDSVLVDGVAVRRGHRVRMCPRARGADAQDMFLAGRTARVEGVFHDVDGSVHLALSVEDDPAAELNAWYGRFWYFRPDEVQPVDGAGADTDSACPDEERPDGCHRTVDA
ncbi:hypothetical protein ITI46_26985 [Streptomyces oryzae]|uniref:Uncharacterized protein n=1 Tax=Streptomyces oryzae TaxID=1434886 RepID=A0ABS3XIP5_9ACTN|nr:hypothetical protein [Streptomyces oryzae]MBO8195266.1 hypothetical protein [Streptomyces oryzae]